LLNFRPSLALFKKDGPNYHPASTETVDAIVGWKEGK
jgi:hypothetical protein